MKKKKELILSREEELELLAKLDEKIRCDPAFGFKLLQRAGIYDENGQLTEPYRAE